MRRFQVSLDVGSKMKPGLLMAVIRSTTCRIYNKTDNIDFIFVSHLMRYCVFLDSLNRALSMGKVGTRAFLKCS